MTQPVRACSWCWRDLPDHEDGCEAVELEVLREKQRTAEAKPGCECLLVGGVHSDWCSSAPPRPRRNEAPPEPDPIALQYLGWKHLARAIAAVAQTYFKAEDDAFAASGSADRDEAAEIIANDIDVVRARAEMRRLIDDVESAAREGRDPGRPDTTPIDVAKVFDEIGLAIAELEAKGDSVEPERDCLRAVAKIRDRWLGGAAAKPGGG